MAQLNDTLVNGDLRVNGKIYGIITSADSATNASNLGSTAASDFALKNGNYSSNGLVAKSASTAASAQAAIWTEKSDDRTYRVAFSLDNKFYYSQHFNYNASTQTLCAKNISSVNITGTVSGNLSGSAASALTSKSALTAGYATSAGAAPVASHPFSSHTNFSTYFNATSANSALTSKSALSAGSASTAFNAYWSKADDNTDVDRIIGLAYAGSSASWTAGNGFNNAIAYDKEFTFNSKTNILKAPNISATNITAATTVRGTNLSGTNISGATKTMTVDNLISSATRTIPTVNNKTITITTGASPATASFSTNTAADKTITLGSMALKSSGDYIPTSWSGATASLFSGKASSAVSASGAGSATKAVNDNYGNAINASSYLTKSWSGATASLFSGKASSADNASTAANANKGVWAAVTDNRNYPVAISLDSKFNYTTTAGVNHIYFNPASGQLNVVSAVKIGGCQMKWNASTSALDFNF